MNYFPVESGESLIDKGLTFEVETFFYMNHWSTDKEADPDEDFHYSLTAYALLRFSILKTNLNTYYPSTVTLVSKGGKWVQYEVNKAPYASVLDDGDLSPSILGGQTPSTGQCFKVGLLTSGDPPTTIYLAFENILQSNTDLDSRPDYHAKVKYKIRAINYEQDDHTTETL